MSRLRLQGSASTSFQPLKDGQRSWHQAGLLIKAEERDPEKGDFGDPVARRTHQEGSIG